MENQSPEISQYQEYKSEIRLTSQKVADVYRDATSDLIGNGNRLHVDDLVNKEVFNKDKLEDNREVIEKLADQLQPRFSKKDVGFDWTSAGYDKYQTQWASSPQDIKHLLSLISAIGLGRFTTSRAELRASPKTPLRYLIDKDRYQK